jgi:hypothetical protein
MATEDLTVGGVNLCSNAGGRKRIYQLMLGPGGLAVVWALHTRVRAFLFGFCPRTPVTNIRFLHLAQVTVDHPVRPFPDGTATSASNCRSPDSLQPHHRWLYDSTIYTYTRDHLDAMMKTHLRQNLEPYIKRAVFRVNGPTWRVQDPKQRIAKSVVSAVMGYKHRPCGGRAFDELPWYARQVVTDIWRSWAPTLTSDLRIWTRRGERSLVAFRTFSVASSS